MKPSSLAAFLFFLALVAHPSARAADDTPSVERLAWLAGCWAVTGAEAGSEEHWLAPAGASLLGVSRTVRQGRTVGYEFMRIAAGPDGRLAFHAQPSGKPPAAFPVLRHGDREIVFENLEHGFPQRILYRFEPPATLQARIEGMRDGSLRGIDYPMVRVPCDAAGDRRVAAP